ncbi:hypothetical protein GCM10011487_62650 [Steroidobacter agaridevorans]|uniref:Ice-binding protein C-terminal domain-containing protein n=1 Tax=Steroidobacter agaridevorans TaxID=2695856 RepID=A0A829YLS7_9GAMM|nr:VPLPA-CTERM sorting domain-containing protein [Steroidobacter agaridevorans]GFE84265.1 hypothetical protein GCM10011487_62650 [Steroidobacter agaridevorans]GFE87090.1 hypothetical protein GCM10011488_20440 [Steroidobacter agaridevorans]
MEISLKNVVAIAIAGASALGAMTASADVINTDTGNGELTLFVRNDTTGDVYARGLQIRLDDILTESAIQTGGYTPASANQRGYVLPQIGPDANLSSFLSQSGSFTWTIMAGDNTGLVNVTGGKRYLTTTPADLTNGTSVTINNLGSSYNNLFTMINQLNAFLPDTSGSSITSNGQWRQTGSVPGQVAGDWYGIGPNNVNALGSAANFYMLAAPGGSGAARVYQFADVTLLADGTLASAVSSVPLPAAFWLLGTGLAGLAGVSRRRKSA